MARGTPAVERTVAVLDLLANHPGLSLTEIARRSGIGKGSTHALLTSLLGAGYVVRQPPDGAYALGPAVVALGQAAAGAALGVLDYARPEMERLSGELGLQCLASAALGEEIVILARAGLGVALGLSVDVGQRVPLVPPLGTVFVAWSSAADIDAWLQRLGAASSADVGRYRRAIATVRRRGYSVGLEADARVRLGRALAELGGGSAALRRHVRDLVDDLGHEEYILGALTGSATYNVNHLAAPILDQSGRVVLALTLVGFAGQLDATDVPRLGRRLVRAAASVTSAMAASRAGAS